MSPLFAIGDIHGQLDKLRRLLMNARLMSPEGNWTGADCRLVFMGDFMDRGEDGVGVLDLIMRLQRQAGTAGGKIQAVMGNHDPLILAALYFSNERTSYGATFYDVWEQNGGSASDLQRLRAPHISWLAALPAMLRIGQNLIVHADSLLYRQHGDSIETVNASFARIMSNNDTRGWDQFLEQFADRGAYDDRSPEGLNNARMMLRQYGGMQILHGHTPITKMSGVEAEQVTEALVYAGGLCINLDGGMYMGSRGFVWRDQE